MKSYKCPLCGSRLTKAKYESVLRIEREKERLHTAELDTLHRKIHVQSRNEQKLRRALEETRRQVRQAEKIGVQRGAATEKKRQERLTAGLRKKLAVATSRIKQLERGTTPQLDGFAFEDQLYKQLRKEFPEDRIEHKGKGGDVLQTVRFKGEDAGTIVYECKRTPSISNDHIRQCSAAKHLRKAHFAILVTTGTRKGFNGLGNVDEVLLVAPAGVIPLAVLCRGHLIEMAKAKLDQTQRNRVANELLGFITSPAHRVPLEQAIQHAREADRILRKEVKDHIRVWKRRFEVYQCIDWDLSQIQVNIHRVLGGSRPLALQKQRVVRFALPTVSD